MSAFCKDCGMDTEPWPPHRGTQEHYIVKNEVWQQAGMPLGKADADDNLSIRGGGGILCVGCIEKRLGRLLTREDFVPITLKLLEDSQNTPRLLSRVGVDPIAAAAKPLPDYIVDQWLETTLKNAMKGHRPRVEDVEVNGDEIILVGKEGGELVGAQFRAGPQLKAFREALRWDRQEEWGGGEIDLLPCEE